VAAKICAFGVHVHRRVAMHGFALNLTVDLEAFRLIVPCGLAGTTVTSLQALTGHSPPIEEVAAEVATAFSRSFGRRFERAADRDRPLAFASDRPVG
jgi:lipoyl(octanoyl) transferase